MEWQIEGASIERDDPCRQQTILFILLPERSAFNASFTLARRLKTAGYRVLYGGPKQFQEHVRAQGFRYELFEASAPESTAAAGKAAPGPFGRWLLLRRRVRQGRRISDELMERCEERLRAIRPELVLLDPLIWPYALPPLKCGIPILGFSTSLAAAFNPAVPPAFCDLQPVKPPGWKASLRHRIAWGTCLGRVWWRLRVSEYVWPLRLLLPPRTSMTSRIASQGGRLRWSEYGPRLDVPELVVSPKELDFPQAVASSRRIYIGSCVEVSRQDGSFDWSWLAYDKPLLYCSLGTYSHVYRYSRRLFDAVIGALLQRDDLQAVVQVGTCAEIEAFGEQLPERIRLVKHAPQLEILARAQIFITHGGLSSVREAIYFGVPMLVFPCWNEQPGNAARVIHHGLGLSGDIASVDTLSILGLLERIADPCFSERIRGMQAVFHRQQACQTGVDYIDAFLKGGKYGEPLSTRQSYRGLAPGMAEGEHNASIE